LERVCNIRLNLIRTGLINLITSIFSVTFLFLPDLTDAFNLNLEKDLQKYLKQSRHTAQKAREKQKEKQEIKDEVKFLKSTLNDVKELYQLLQEKFAQREEELQALGPLPLERHRAMVASYQKALEEYINFVESLPSSGKVSEDVIEDLNTFLDKILYIKKIPIYGSLPYKNLNFLSREPTQDPAIQPAYKGGNTTVSPEDLGNTIEAPLSLEIATLAQSLNWNPVSIYEYVKNNIETEWYWGCMKGAEETLRQKSGNDCDQATLLTALLRSSGFPSRYVRGVIEFFPDIEKAKNLTGIDDPWKIAAFFQKAGIPFKPVISAGKIKNFQIEHMWVESYIPYANYRGTIIDEYGKTWLGLDTSIKARDYQFNAPLDILQETSFTNIREEYLGALQTQTPLEYIRTIIEAYLSQKYPGTAYSELLSTKTLAPEVTNILPASLQFNQVKITNEYTEISDGLKHKAKFTATDINNKELFTITLNALNLSNQKMVLSYEPETVEDQQIINYYGGLDNTPCYLVRLRPVLKVNGERVIVAKDGLPMGADYSLTIELISPNGTERITGTHVIGNLTILGLISRKAVKPEEIPNEDKDAEKILYEAVTNYIDRLNQAEDELAAMMQLIKTRPLPTVANIGGVIDVTYFLDMPHGFEWKGEYIDANLRAIETIDTKQSPADRQKTFTELSGLQGSILENRIFEDDWEVESISTAKMISLANSNQTPVLTIDKTNIDSVLPNLPFAEDIKEDITNAVNQNLTVKIPNQEITYDDWTGMGYIKENLNTKESGYMLTGMIAGGMTALSPYKWSLQYFAEKLGKPYGSTYNTIDITSPENGATVTTSLITVSGMVLDPQAKVSVNGVEAIVEGTTFTAYGVTLNKGMNTITAIATSKTGKQTSDTIIINYEIPVIVYITFPYDGASLSVSTIDVEGIVNESSTTVVVNGVNAVVSGSGRFIATGIALSEGENQITAQATNIYGKTGSYAIKVNYTGEQLAPIPISITYPEANATINKPFTMVRGTFTAYAEEVSINVNGILAEKYDNQFVASGVPLVDGQNRIIVNALGSNGAVGRAEITINAVTTSPYITLSSNITSGIPPLTAYFSVSTEIPNPAAEYQIDFQGDDVIDYTGTTFEDINYTYMTEGVFYPTVTVIDDQGNTYTDTIAITVLNKAQIDALLKGKWEGMKGALAVNDINKAMSYFGDFSKDKYKRVFLDLGADLPSIINSLADIVFVSFYGNVAEYAINRLEDGMNRLYFIYFIRDENGLWKIDSL
jgi:PKD repeat protein